MPEIHLDIPEQATHILEPIAEQNIMQTIYQLGMTSKIADRLYIDYGYSSIKSRTIKTLDANFKNNKVQCEVNFNLTQTGAKVDNYTFVHAPSYGITKNSYGMSKPILYDKDANIRMYAQNMPVTIITNYTFSLIERSLAYGLTARIKNVYGDGGLYDTKDVSFSYPLPIPFLNTLFGLYSLKEGVDINKYPLYLMQESGNQISINNNRTHTSTEVIVKCTNVEALSNYTHDDEKPAEQKSRKVAETYEVKLTHTFQLSLPNSIYMEYPIIVDNNVVPEELIILNKSTPIRNLKQTPDILPWRRPMQDRVGSYGHPIKFPVYDDWIIPTKSLLKYNNYNEIFHAAFCIDEASEIQEFDMLDDGILDGYTFHPIIDHFLLLQGEESFRHDVLFNLTIFKNNRHLDVERCDMDHYGNMFIRSQDTKSVHRLVLSELTDLSKLNPKWLGELEDWFKNHCVDKDHPCCPDLKGLGGPDPQGPDDGSGVLRRIRFYFRACRTNMTTPRSLMNSPNSVI